MAGDKTGAGCGGCKRVLRTTPAGPKGNRGVPYAPPVETHCALRYDTFMERVVHKAASFDEADDWDVRQQLAMSPQERLLAARELQRRFYGPHPIGLREWHKKG